MTEQETLFYRQTGREPAAGVPAVILLHGLFGMGSNLANLAKTLAPFATVYSVDLPNHGRSPRTDSVSYPSQSEQLLQWMDSQNLNSAYCVGHSMGGKVAMQLALTAPQRVAALVVLDIAPVEYPPAHDEVLAALQQVPLASLQSRQDAERSLATTLTDASVRGFLLKSLYRNADGQFSWRFNLPLIAAQYQDLRAGLTGEAYQGKVLFIRGEQSGYIRPQNYAQMQALFPNGELKTVQGAGHWLHADKPVAVNRLVSGFFGWG